MSAEYFHERLTYGEAGDYLEGMARRYRQGWEQSRLVADVVAKVAGNKNGTGLEFPWEAEDTALRQAPPSEEEYAELLAEKEKYDNELQNSTRT